MNRKVNDHNMNGAVVRNGRKRPLLSRKANSHDTIVIQSLRVGVFYVASKWRSVFRGLTSTRFGRVAPLWTASDSKYCVIQRSLSSSCCCAVVKNLVLYLPVCSG